MLNLGMDIQYNDLRTCPLIYIYIYSIKNNKNMFMIIYNVCILPFSVRKYGPSTRMCGCSTAVLD